MNCNINYDSLWVKLDKYVSCLFEITKRSFTHGCVLKKTSNLLVRIIFMYERQHFSVECFAPVRAPIQVFFFLFFMELSMFTLNGFD